MLCNRPLLENDKKAEYECGCHIVHTKCAINEIYTMAEAGFDITCNTCLMNLHEGHFIDNNVPNYDSPDDSERIQNLLQDQTFKDELKKIKHKINQQRLLASNCNKKINEHYNTFKSAIIANISNIKLLKKESINAIKLSEEYLSEKRTAASLLTSLTNLKRKYNLNYHDLKLLHLRYVRRFWYARPGEKIKRKFRIRIL